MDACAGAAELGQEFAGLVEDLDPEIERIHHEEVACAVQGNVRRVIELPCPGAALAE